jgi:hypothetical protein
VVREKFKDTLDRETVLAWQIANFTRAKKLPGLKAILAKSERLGKPKPQGQTPGQMKSVFAMLGYQAKPVSDEAKKATRLKLQ